MTILAVGCSFLCRRSEVRPQVEVMAETLGEDLDNRSISGNGNTHILYNTMNAILTNPKPYSLVCIGWSSPNRWDYVTAPHKWFAIKMGTVVPTFAKQAINYDDTLFRHYAPSVLLMTEFLRSRSIPFIMWNSLPCWYDGASVFQKNILEMPEFYKPTTSHIEDLESKGEWISEEDHHPNQKSHNAWADQLLDFHGRFRTS